MLAKRSIKTGLLIILGVIVILSTIIYAYIYISSAVDVGITTRQITADALRNQAEKFLVQLTTIAAQKNNDVLESVRKDAGEVAVYAQNIFEHPEGFATHSYWKFDEHVFMGKGGQHMNGPEDISSVFISNYTNIADVKEEMELSAYLDSTFLTTLENNPSSMAVYFIGLQGEIRYYPNIGLGNVLSPGERLQEGIFFSVADPKNNPERKVVWTPVYDDLAGQGPMITASAPIYTEQKGFIGVLSMDVTLNAIIRNIEEYNPVEHSYSFLIDKDGYSIALPEEGYQEILGRERGANESRANLNNISNEFGPVIKKMKEGSTGFQEITIGNEELYVAYAPLESTGFSLGIVAEKAIVLKAVSDIYKEIKDSMRNMIYYRILPAGLLILIASLAIGFFLINRIIKPVKNLTDMVERAAKGDFNTRIKIKSTDEIGRLASAFNQMVMDLKELHKKLRRHEKELEETVESRTKQLAKKIKELEDTKIAILNMLEDVNFSKDDLEKSQKELLKLNKDLKNANTELKRMDTYKNEFISVTAHELKTPLASIHGFAGLLKNKKILSNPKQRDYYLNIIMEDADRLKKLIDDILDLSRLDLGTLKFMFDNVNLEEVFKDVIKEMYLLAAKKGVTLKASVTPNVPNTIITDKGRLHQILINLVNNAVKYTDKKGRKIVITASREGDKVLFSVKDQGIGIDKKYLSKLFQRFYQIDSSYTRKVGGSGLGLAICKGIAEALGGKIWLTSKVGKGTTFFFTLPIKSKRAVAEEKELKVIGEEGRVQSQVSGIKKQQKTDGDKWKNIKESLLNK